MARFTHLELQRLCIDRGVLRRVFDLDPTFRSSAFVLEYDGGRTLVVAEESRDEVVMLDLSAPSWLNTGLGERQAGRSGLGLDDAQQPAASPMASSSSACQRRESR